MRPATVCGSDAMRALLVAFLAGLAVTLVGAGARAADQALFARMGGALLQGMWDDIAARADCSKTDYPKLTMFTCDGGTTLWYFTRPGHAAHPGVIERSFITDADGGTSVQEDGRSFGDAAAQPAFKAWLDSFVALDK